MSVTGGDRRPRRTCRASGRRLARTARGRRQDDAAAASSPTAPPHGGTRARPASRAAAVRPATPVTGQRTSAPSSVRAPAPSPRRSPPRTAAVALEHLGRNVPGDAASRRSSTRRRSRRRRRSSRPRPSAAPRRAARAGLGRSEREPELAAAVEDERRDRPLVRREQVGREALLERAREALGPAVAARRGTCRRGSRDRGADRHLEPLPSPPPPRAPGPRRTRSARRNRAAGVREPHTVEHATQWGRLESRGRARGARWRPGQGDATRPSCSRTTAGAVPARPRTRPPTGTDACLRTPARSLRRAG